MRRAVGQRPSNQFGIIWVDRATRVVARNKRAVPLKEQEFLIFDLLHRQGHRCRPKVALSQDVVSEVYRGVADPPLYAATVVRATKDRLNRKIAHLRLRIKVVSRGRLTEYRLEELT